MTRVVKLEQSSDQMIFCAEWILLLKMQSPSQFLDCWWCFYFDFIYFSSEHKKQWWMLFPHRFRSAFCTVCLICYKILSWFAKINWWGGEVASFLDHQLWMIKVHMTTLKDHSHPQNTLELAHHLFDQRLFRK